MLPKACFSLAPAHSPAQGLHREDVEVVLGEVERGPRGRHQDDAGVRRDTCRISATSFGGNNRVLVALMMVF
jgi:hypothetical protein